MPGCSDLLVTSEATNRTARLHFTNYNEEVWQRRGRGGACMPRLLLAAAAED